MANSLLPSISPFSFSTIIARPFLWWLKCFHSQRIRSAVSIQDRNQIALPPPKRNWEPPTLSTVFAVADWPKLLTRYAVPALNRKHLPLYCLQAADSSAILVIQKFQSPIPVFSNNVDCHKEPLHHGHVDAAGILCHRPVIFLRYLIPHEVRTRWYGYRKHWRPSSCDPSLA